MAVLALAGGRRRGAGAAGRVIRAPEDNGDGVEGGLVLAPGVARAAERGGRVAGGLLLAITTERTVKVGNREPQANREFKKRGCQSRGILRTRTQRVSRRRSLSKRWSDARP